MLPYLELLDVLVTLCEAGIAVTGTGPLGHAMPADLGDAYRALLQRIAADPQDVEVRVQRGAALRALGHHREALADLNQALHLDPKHARAWLLTSEVLYSLRRYDDARTARQAALKLDPGVAD
jgi:tetratricopeptide (TPR) repeat protein